MYDQINRWLLLFFHSVETGVPKNIKKALKYLKCAADKGNGEAQYHLGIIVDQIFHS
jgi:TPR repeat protein